MEKYKSDRFEGCIRMLYWNGNDEKKIFVSIRQHIAFVELLKYQNYLVEKDSVRIK